MKIVSVYGKEVDVNLFLEDMNIEETDVVNVNTYKNNFVSYNAETNKELLLLLYAKRYNVDIVQDVTSYSIGNIVIELDTGIRGYVADIDRHIGNQYGIIFEDDITSVFWTSANHIKCVIR